MTLLKSREIFRLEQFIQQQMIIDLLPVWGDVQFFKEGIGVKIGIDLAAVASVIVVPQAPPAKGDIPPFFSKAGIAHIHKAAELAILQKYTGKAVVTVGQNRYGGDGAVFQPVQQMRGAFKAPGAEGFRFHIVHVHQTVFHPPAGFLQEFG